MPQFHGTNRPPRDYFTPTLAQSGVGRRSWFVFVQEISQLSALSVFQWIATPQFSKVVRPLSLQNWPSYCFGKQFDEFCWIVDHFCGRKVLRMKMKGNLFGIIFICDARRKFCGVEVRFRTLPHFSQKKYLFWFTFFGKKNLKFSVAALHCLKIHIPADTHHHIPFAVRASSGVPVVPSWLNASSERCGSPSSVPGPPPFRSTNPHSLLH